MRTLTRTVLVTTALALLLLASACGSSGDDDVVAGAGTDGDTPVSSPPTVVTLPDTSGDTVPLDWTRIEPTEDLVGARTVEPAEVVVDPDDEAVVLVRFYGGVQDCYGARATVVTESATTVEIRLETGTRPEAADRACIEIAEAQELAVALDAPLADRTLTARPAA